MNNEMLEIVVKNNVEVVDSRLIAIELGIQHESFIKTVKGHQTRLEKRGVLRFEIAKPLKGSSGGRPETFYWLNERHCIFLTTLCRNTEQVVELKDKIEESFYQARQANKNNNSELDLLKLEIEKLKLEKENIKLNTELDSHKLALVETTPLVKENQNLIKQSMECISILEEEKFEREYYLEKLNEITKEHPLFKSLIELKMLIKLNSYSFPDLNYSIKDLSLLFMPSKITPRDLAFYSSHLYFLDYCRKPYKDKGYYTYAGKDLIYPLLVLFKIEGFSWENLRDSLEIDYLLKFPTSNRGFLPV